MGAHSLVGDELLWGGSLDSKDLGESRVSRRALLLGLEIKVRLRVSLSSPYSTLRSLLPTPTLPFAEHQLPLPFN